MHALSPLFFLSSSTNNNREVGGEEKWVEKVCLWWNVAKANPT
jgi:hypothetical protein